jgi:hypothetical protein
MNGIALTEELKSTLTQFYVYAYIRQRNSPIGNVGTPYYIGKGKDDRAWAKHRKTPVPKDISRIIIIDQNLTEEEAFTLEVKMIAGYGRVDNETGILRNLTDGGDGSSGAIHSDETRRKISESKQNPSQETRRKLSEANKGKIRSEETRRKMSEARKRRTHSEETRRKLSEKSKGRTPSEETRRKISESNKGKIRSEETRRNIGDAAKGRIPWNKGRTHSEETRRKMSEASKSRRNTVASGSSIYAFLDGKA